MIEEKDKPYLRVVAAHVMKDVLQLKQVEHELLQLTIGACSLKLTPAEVFVQRRVILKKVGLMPSLPGAWGQHDAPEGLTLALYCRAHGVEGATNAEVNRWADKLWKAHNEKVRLNVTAQNP